MTAKRFKLYEHKDNDYILDNPHEHLDFIEMLGDALTSEEIVDLLNKLHEEIQKCKEYNGILYANHTKTDRGLVKQISELKKENEQLKQQLKELKEDVPLLLAFYRWYPFAVEKKEHQAYNRLWDFVND